MNTQTINQARRGRLFHQSQILRGAEQPTLFDESGAPAIDLDRAPYVLRDVGVPPALSGATFLNSKFTQVDDVRAWLVDLLNRESNDHLALIIGNGSNYTAAAVLRNAVKRGRTVAWYDWHSFTQRYTEKITRDRLLEHGTDPEETSNVVFETEQAREEDAYLREVYEILVITDFDIDDVRDFAVPDICAMIRRRSAFELTTVVTVPSANSDPLADRNTRRYGGRGALLRLFEDEAIIFDGR